MRSFVSRARLCALAALIPFAAAPAHAIDQDIALTATVTSSCTLSGSTAPTALTATIPVNNGTVSVTPIVFDIPVACNAAASLRLATLSGGLRKGGPNYPGFSNRIDYVAAVGGGIYLPFSLDTQPVSGQTWTEDYVPAGPPVGNITVTITPKQPASPLLNGTYSDTLRVNLVPSQ